MPESSAFHLLWSHSLLSGPRGLALGREKGWLAAWDEQRWFYLLNVEGKRQGQVNLAESLTAGGVADDGSALAAGSKSGTLWWLNPDLSTRWHRQLSDRVLALALASHGRYLAAADGKDQVYIFDARGELVAQWQCPRPLHHLAFVPAAACLLGSADFGLVAGFDMQGKWLWRDGLVSHVGSLATSGDGALIALACFSDGLQRYRLDGANLGKIQAGVGCRLVAVAFDGRCLLAAGMKNELMVLDGNGKMLGQHKLEKSPLALALAPLADEAYVVQEDGRMAAYQLQI